MSESWFGSIFNGEDGEYEECEHCHGYGSSLNDPSGVDRCTKCGGSGVVKKNMKTKRGDKRC